MCLTSEIQTYMAFMQKQTYLHKITWTLLKRCTKTRFKRHDTTKQITKETPSQGQNQTYYKELHHKPSQGTYMSFAISLITKQKKKKTRLRPSLNTKTATSKRLKQKKNFACRYLQIFFKQYCSSSSLPNNFAS